MLFLDGKIVDSTPTVGQLGRIFFCPDCQHIVTIKRSNLSSLGTRDTILHSIDGKPAVHYMEDNNLGGPYGGNFEFSSDDILSFVGRTDGNLRLFHVTPSPDSSVGTLLASATLPKDKH